MATFKALLLLLSVMAISAAMVSPGHDNTYVEKKMSSEKYTYLHLYVHIAFSGSNATAAKVVQGPTNKPLGFGDMIVVDNPMTEGLDLSSKLIGRELGFTIGVSRDPDLSKTINFLTINLVFTEGEQVDLLSKKDPSPTSVSRSFWFYHVAIVKGYAAVWSVCHGDTRWRP